MTTWEHLYAFASVGIEHGMTVAQVREVYEGHDGDITAPDPPGTYEAVAKIAAEHGFPLSDWRPS